MEKQTSKYIFIELLRIVAAFLVIVNHTNSEIFLSSGISVTWFISLTYFFVSKIAVPIFVIISGYLMLNKLEDYDKHFKRFIRIILVIFIFSLPYYIISEGIGVFNIKDYISTILGNFITNAYWYIYFYAGVLFMMPFLQKLFNALGKRDLHIFFFISCIFNMLWPIIVHYIPALQISGTFNIPIFETYMCLLFIGGYFRKYGIPNIPNLAYIIVFFSCLLFNVLATYNEFKINSGWYLFFDNRDFLPIVLQSVCVFGLFSRISIGGQVASIVQVIGSCTFGIYLLSDFFIEELRFIYVKLCENGLYPLLAVLIFEIVIFVIGFVVTCIMKKIPFLKNLL